METSKQDPSPAPARRRRPRKIARKPTASISETPAIQEPKQEQKQESKQEQKQIGPVVEEVESEPEAQEPIPIRNPTIEDLSIQSPNSSRASSRRRRRKPRKLAVRSASTPQTAQLSTNPDETVIQRVSILESRVEEINYRLESTVTDVHELRTTTTTHTPTRPATTTSKSTPASRATHSAALVPVTQYPTSISEPNSDTESEIETIPRTTNQPDQLALKGSYRVPLPRGVSMQDVQAISRGASAATHVVREVNAAFRATTSVRTGGRVSTSASSRVVQMRETGTSSGQGGGVMGGIFAQATRLVSEAMGAVEAGAAVERERPQGRGRQGSARQGRGRGRKYDYSDL
ncbi:hypothetical protein BT63DRAFT_425072 [Microthyrium microscopicum]|uniref:Uncharacterized protein n=1 Tax=Microthyrium microscopicum TaxID=703497 RepID=A0A6A6UEM0_9PEZI|nr:hypothetical protein BT63DRAFT_425072 [Microthyrium microscopicum]